MCDDSLIVTCHLSEALIDGGFVLQKPLFDHLSAEIVFHIVSFLVPKRNLMNNKGYEN